MQYVGFVAAVRRVDERDGLVEREYLFVRWVVRRREVRLHDIRELGHVLRQIVLIDQWQQHVLLQADHSQGELRLNLNLNPLLGVLEFVGLRHRVG